MHKAHSGANKDIPIYIKDAGEMSDEHVENIVALLASMLIKSWEIKNSAEQEKHATTPKTLDFL